MMAFSIGIPPRCSQAVTPTPRLIGSTALRHAAAWRIGNGGAINAADP
jgi:hypothetical protein